MTDVEHLDWQRAEIRALCKKQFKADIEVRYILFEGVPIAKGATATVFSTMDHQVYALCLSDNSLVLRDIQRMIRSMGFKAKGYFAPNGDKSYFRRLGYRAFLNAYPARLKWTSDEEAYYQTLVPYSPALVQLEGVGRQVLRYNEVSNKWQKIYEPPMKMWRKVA